MKCPVPTCSYEDNGFHNHPPVHGGIPSGDVRSACTPVPMAMREKTAREAIEERIEDLRRQISELETLSGCLPQVLSDRASARVRDLIGRIR